MKILEVEICPDQIMNLGDDLMITLLGGVFWLLYRPRYGVDLSVHGEWVTMRYDLSAVRGYTN
jgi:hypothetical protein